MHVSLDRVEEKGEGKYKVVKSIKCRRLKTSVPKVLIHPPTPHSVSDISGSRIYYGIVSLLIHIQPAIFIINSKPERAEGIRLISGYRSSTS